LTVTDDGGATNSITKQVTVTAPQTPATVAADQFGRTVASGLGSADTGGAWSVSGATSNYSVSAGAGRLQMAAAGAGPSAFLNAVSARDLDALIDTSIDKPPTGGGYYGSFIVRRTGTSDYRLKLRLTPTGVRAELAKTVSGTETVLSSQLVAGLTYNPGDVLRLRLRVTGSGTTTLQAKVWRVGSAEPAAWLAAATDAEPTLQQAGAVGYRAYISGSFTGAPVVATIDNLNVSTVV
jgi:hypothetical protein